jgi:hypothetical protein
MRFTNVSVGDAAGGHLPEQGIGQAIRVDREIGERGVRVGANYQAVGETFTIDDVDVGEYGMHGLGQRLNQAEVPARAACGDDGDAERGEMIAYLLEKFLGGQLERYVGLLIGIDADHIIFLASCSQEVTPILEDDVQVGFVHVEVLPRKVHNRAIDLHALDGKRRRWNRRQRRAATSAGWALRERGSGSRERRRRWSGRKVRQDEENGRPASRRDSSPM